ncbi:regulation of nuclear pre-mRNA domain-containing protein 1B isoform X1 [Anolis carolinensis]|uniref:Regulation of nuclear pre-mRNA domain containing 1B n=1 Tax=Anolis carolinensis TaxID=28377 RepID=H9GJQ3_ANOCA|nr:PREDICTED: regulation of nuclear pre-mRNA domain-containing protein 1B isoform X1 [Anolis carolinensis]|eukprot:XP_008119775.1 PREDICTED: regulation of nuclear pre-mRNA domain-containing protein 1B isoform X1 [Anolis carolinensis]
MSSFSESALERKLSELSNSQQSVQTLSLWLIHHRKHAAPVVNVWHRELRKAKSSRKLTFLYLANDVIQNSKRKGPEFTREFETVLVDAFSHVAREADEGCKKPLERLLTIWQERSVYGSEFIQQLKLSMEDSNSPQPKEKKKSLKESVFSVAEKKKSLKESVFSVTEEKKSLKRTFQQIQEEEDDDYPGSYSPQDPNAGPLLTEDLIKALQDLENAASGDATVRQKIASLPQEVQDVSLLEKITDKEAAERLSKTVDEACLLLAEYNGRLAAELEDRRQLARMLIEYTQNQKDVLTEKEKKLEEYKQKLARVTQVRKELKSHIQSLPDLSLLPNVTGGLAPLPSAGDLFSTD